MKSNVILEYSDIKVTDNECFEKVKEIWKTDGNKIKDIKSMNLYMKPEEQTVYYVINESYTGSFPM